MTAFVSPDWVAARISQPNCLIIDPRSAMRYLMGHLPGAVSVPFKKLQGPDGRLAPPEQLAAAFGAAGLGDHITPILYDHQDGRNAAMAAWVLEYLGRSDVHIMNLRYEAWKEQGREVLYRPVPVSAQTFTSRLNASVRATLADAARPAPAKLLDTRSAAEFNGAAEMDHRPGHIPGAVNLEHTAMAAAGNHLLIDPGLLRQRLAACGITPADPVIAYCRSGVRAALAYIAMRQAGYAVRLYDGSYAEWMDSDRPVAIGSASNQVV